ncbi:MAG: hypothetical protein AAGA01_03970, partial [Cyanobacteria bacterium P01_E01_bin.43]
TPIPSAEGCSQGGVTNWLIERRYPEFTLFMEQSQKPCRLVPIPSYGILDRRHLRHLVKNSMVKGAN